MTEGDDQPKPSKPRQLIVDVPGSRPLDRTPKRPGGSNFPAWVILGGASAALLIVVALLHMSKGLTPSDRSIVNSPKCPGDEVAVQTLRSATLAYVRAHGGTEVQMDRASEAIEVGDHCTVTLSGQFTARWRDGSRTREGFDISGSPEDGDGWNVEGPYLFDGAEVLEPPR